MGSLYFLSPAVLIASPQASQLRQRRARQSSTMLSCPDWLLGDLGKVPSTSSVRQAVCPQNKKRKWGRGGVAGGDRLGAVGAGSVCVCVCVWRGGGGSGGGGEGDSISSEDGACNNLIPNQVGT